MDLPLKQLDPMHGTNFFSRGLDPLSPPLLWIGLCVSYIVFHNTCYEEFLQNYLNSIAYIHVHNF